MTPRRLAVKALMHQEQAGYANLVLDAELKKCVPPPDARDAAFAARIFYTVLEYLPLLDHLLDRFSKQTGPAGARDPAGWTGAGALYAGAAACGSQ